MSLVFCLVLVCVLCEIQESTSSNRFESLVMKPCCFPQSWEDESRWVEDLLQLHTARVRDVELLTGLDFYRSAALPYTRVLALKTHMRTFEDDVWRDVRHHRTWRSHCIVLYTVSYLLFTFKLIMMKPSLCSQHTPTAPLPLVKKRAFTPCRDYRRLPLMASAWVQ